MKYVQDYQETLAQDTQMLEIIGCVGHSNQYVHLALELSV